jgi:hypothetical protein
MLRAFDVTSPSTTITVGGKSSLEVMFAVTNHLDHGVKVRASVIPDGPTDAKWLSLVEPLKNVSIKQTETFTVRVTLPPGTKPGDYAFKIVVANDANPEEESTEGPAVMLHVGARTKPAFPWWWILIGAGIVALAVGLSFFVRWLIHHGDEPGPDIDPALCSDAPDRLLVGDFNGDGLADVVCQGGNGSTTVLLRKRGGGFTRSVTNGSSCSEPGARIFIGDYNGDRHSDILCNDSISRKAIAFAQADGKFDTWNAMPGLQGWCSHAAGQFLVGDFNGDGRTDLLCHDTGSGYKWIAQAQANGTFNGTTWEKPLNWCYGVTAQLLLGDFNGDGKTDMLCHEKANGYKWVSLAQPDGTFIGTSWESPMAWCNHFGSHLLVADTNGDGRSDLVCHDNTGHLWVALATPTGTFTGTSSEIQAGWCPFDTVPLVGDFNGDGRSDLFCRVDKSVRLAKADGSFAP